MKSFLSICKLLVIHCLACIPMPKRSIVLLLSKATLVVLLTSGMVQAQVNIVDPNAANPPDVNACSGQTTLAALFQFVSNGPNAVVNIPIPTGIDYIPGSVMLVSQTGGLSIAQTSASLSAPVFTITASDGTINNGNQIQFKFKVRARCAAVAGTAILPLNVTYNGAVNTGEVATDVIKAELNLTAHAIQSAAIGTPVTVDINVMNGGLGAIDSVDFYITESGMTTTGVKVNGIASTLISNIAGTRLYRIYSNALPGGTFNNPETIIVKRTVVLTSCTFSSSYGVNWGCDGMSCQTPQPTGPGEFLLLQGIPNLNVTSNLITATNLCGQPIIDLVYTNNGSGPASAAAAFNTIFKIGMGGTGSWASTSWTAASVLFNGNTVVYTGGSNGNPIVINASQFTSDPDGAGVGLADLDNDGFFDELPLGASATIRVKLAYACPVACPAPNDNATMQAGGTWTDQCGGTGSSSLGTVFSFNNSLIGGPVQHCPNTLTDGQVFNAEICYARDFSYSASLNCPDNKVRLTLSLPDGVTATGNGMVNGVSVATVFSGNTAYVEGVFQSGDPICLSVELRYDCPSPDNFNIGYELTYVCDAACACKQKWACGNFPITSVKCDACPEATTKVTNVKVERTTLGFTDHTGTTRVTNPATLPALSLLKGMPCDTFKFTVNGRYGSATDSTYDNLFMEFSYDRLGGANLLDFTTGNFIYFDKSTNTNASYPLPAPNSTTVGGRHVIRWNLSPALPAGLIENGDSIVAYPRFIVLNNATLTGTATPPGNTSLTLFTIDSLSGNPTTATRYSCNQFKPELYLHNPEPILNAVAGGRTGCGNYMVSGSIQHEVCLAKDEYPKEIRPIFSLSGVEVQILNGDSYDPSFTPVLTILGGTDDAAYPLSINLPNPTIAGNKLTWTNPGSWPVADFAGFNPNATGYTIKFKLLNSGCVNAADGTLKTVWKYKRFAYAVDPACMVNVTSSAQTGTVSGGAPSFSLTNLSGTQYGYDAIECYQVKIQNNSNDRPAGYVWLALEDNLSPMDVVSVRNTSTNTLLPLLSYANGKWVKIATSYPGGTSTTLEVCVRYTNCSNNQMRLIQGWDCNAYPTNPTTYTCGVKEAFLRLIPAIADIQGNFTATSPLPATMCEDFVFNMLVNSSQVADLYQPRVRVTLPNGMTLNGPVQIEYPLNSGNWQNATPTISGQAIEVNLTNHTGIKDTLPGTVHANVATYTGGEDRQADVRFKVKTSCDFLAGDKIKFEPFAKSACGANVPGNGATFLSPRIRIAGADPTYEGTFNFNIGGGNVFEGCYEKTMTVNVQLADVNTMDGLPATTGTADTIELYLPKWVDYVPGTYVCSTFPTANCANFISTQVLADGRRLLKFALPSSISIPNGGSAPIVFKVNLQVQQNISCSINENITGRVIAVYTNIYCAATMMNCPKVIALAGEGSMPIVFKKLKASFESVNIACNSLGGFNYTTKVKIDVLPLKADSFLVVEYHCLDALGVPFAAPIELDTIFGPKAIGSVVTLTGSFTGCDPMNGVRVTLPYNTAAGDNQCVCMPLEYNSVGLPKCPGVTVVADPDPEICANATVTVKATLLYSATAGTWSSSGTGIFSSTTALTTVYTPSSADIALGSVILTFTTNDPTGTCQPGKASVQIIIRPIPVVANATLTVCASSFGGSTGSFNLSLADNLVDPADVHTVTYHASLANAQAGTSPLSSPYTAANNAVVYARVVNAFGCAVTTATVTLKVNALPSASNATLSACENDPNGSGIGTFNLNLANSQINNGGGLTITYHATLLDAQNGINALESPYLGINGAVLYARVSNNSTACYNTATLTLTVRPKPIAYSAQLQACPTSFDGTQASFTLSNANSQVTGGVGGLTVTYHQSLVEAQQGINALANSYTSVTDDVWARVVNGFGCYAVDIVQLVVLENPEIIASSTNVTCFGAANGTAQVQVLGGAPAYTYDWSNDGAENPDNDFASLSGLTPGTYMVTVTDANGCSAQTSTSVIQPAALSIATVTSTPVSCFGAANGTATVVPAGGTAPYTYDWSNDGAENPDNDPATVNGLAGSVGGITYTVTVTDANGCSTSTSVVITQPATPVVATITAVSNPTCTSNIAGSATASGSGGTGPYDFVWSSMPAQSSINDADNTHTANNLSAGAYQVTITDVNNCTATAIANLNDPTGIDASIDNKLDVSCYGAANGSASVTVIPAGASVTYDWGTPSANTTPTGDGTASVSGLAPGNYLVTVTQNGTGCKAIAFVSISQPAPLSAISSGIAPKCNGASNGAASVSVQGGTAPYTYNWNGTPSGDATANISGLTAGTYTVTVTDANNCTVSATVTLSNPTALSLITNGNPVSCFGGNNGSVTVIPAGGTAPYTYDWSNDGAENPDNDAATITDLTAGTYTVTVSDANGCQTSTSVSIAQPASAVQVNITATTQPTCVNNTAGSATALASGGVGPYDFAWLTPTPQVSVNDADNTHTATNLAAGTYLVSVTDANGCTAIAVANLNDPSGIDASINNKTDVSCYGAANGTASVTVVPANAAVTYDWGTSAANTTPTGDGTANVSGLAPGNYLVTVTENGTGCSAVAFVMIMQPEPLVAVASGVAPKCNGASNGSASVNVTGGVAPYSYNWNGTPTGDGNNAISGLSAGTYTVTVTDANNCTTTATVTLSNPSVLTVSINNVVPVSCFGGNNGSATVVPVGGTAPYTYDWSNDGSENPDNDAATATDLTAGTYTVTVTDVNGCQTSTSVVISQPSTAVNATITNTTNATCSLASGSATVLATGGTIGSGYTYDWSNDGFENPDNDAASINNVAAGAYIVVVTDGNGCTATAVANVANPAGLSASITAQSDATCLDGLNGAATVTAVGGTAPFDFDWSHTVASPDVLNQPGNSTSLNNLAVGNYTITVTDANNCTAIAFVTIKAVDVVAPIITACPTNITNLTCGQSVPAPHTTVAAFEAAGGNVSDNCTVDANLMIRSSDYDNGLSYCNNDGLHTIIRTYVILDQFNNKSTCTQTISFVEDVTPPQLTTAASNLPCINGCLNGTIPPAVQNWLANNGGAAATDACSAVSWTNNFDAVAAQALCGVGGTLSVTFTAKDACGNTTQTTATICIS